MRPSIPPRQSPPAQAANGSSARAGKAPLAGDSHAGSLPAYDIFSDALDGAMALVQADGGALALLDEARQVMVLRALSGDSSGGGRGGHPGHSLPPGQVPGRGAPARPSQPLLGRMPIDGDDIEGQVTQVLPASVIWRTYRSGERLIGTCWQRGEPQVMTGEQCAALPAGHAPADPDAPHHLAVPIFRPGSLTTLALRPQSDIIGVIAVHSNNPHWAFSPHMGTLLALHADRVARALHEIDLGRLAQSEADLLTFLGSDELGDQDTLLRLRDVVRRVMPAPTFAILLVESRRPDLILRVAERGGQSFEPRRIPPSALPHWWDEVHAGRTVYVSTPEDRAQHPECCVVGFGDDTPAQSLLAAPLRTPEAVLGVMLAASGRSDVYGPEHARLFTTIARTAALVLQNRALAHHKLRKDQQLARLNNALLTFHASLDLDTAVATLAKQAAGVADTTMCLAFLLDQPGAERHDREHEPDRERHDPRTMLVGRAASEALDPQIITPLRQVRLPLDWQNLRAALTEGRMLLLDNLDAEWNDGTHAGAFLAEYGVRSCVVLPLVHATEQIGVLLVHSPGKNYLFSAEEMGLLQGLSSQGAVAIHNARLYRRLAEELERREELDRLKEEFILTMSHEFRTPVTAIEGYVGLIERHGDRLDRTKLAQYALEIQQSAEQLTGMITRLADISTVDEHKLQLATVPVNVRHWTDQAIATLPLEAPQRVMADVPPDLWVRADGERLGQVFSNLLGNAIKYSPDDKPVRLSVWRDSRDALPRIPGLSTAGIERAPEQVVMVSVRDFGEGIPAEDIQRLFHKFVRLPRSLTTPVRGTGLGLWICKKYVEAMGGEIWVESEVGKGADFRFWLAPAVAPEDRSS